MGSGMLVEHTPSYLAAAAMIDNRANAIFLWDADVDIRLQAPHSKRRTVCFS
ncbi:MAG: hypothetical protein ACLUKN_05630 [Bacilli bacterium]